MILKHTTDTIVHKGLSRIVEIITTKLTERFWVTEEFLDGMLLSSRVHPSGKVPMPAFNESFNNESRWGLE